MRQSYYTDGHERPDVQAARKEYLRKQRKLTLRKPCWVRVECSSLTREQQEAFHDRRETGEDAFQLKRFTSSRAARNTSNSTSISSGQGRTSDTMLCGTNLGRPEENTAFASDLPRELLASIFMRSRYAGAVRHCTMSGKTKACTSHTLARVRSG